MTKKIEVDEELGRVRIIMSKAKSEIANKIEGLEYFAMAYLNQNRQMYSDESVGQE